MDVLITVKLVCEPMDASPLPFNWRAPVVDGIESALHRAEADGFFHLLSDELAIRVDDVFLADVVDDKPAH